MVVSSYDKADSDSLRWDAERLWNEYEVIASELKYTLPSKEYISKMIDFFLENFEATRASKILKADQSQIIIGELLTCDVCSDLHIDPVTLLCGHSFCKKCLKKREENLFLELCVKCDERQLRRSRWSNFFKQSSLVNYRTNVIVNTLIRESYGDELKAIMLRLEGNQYYARGELTKADDKYKEAVQICMF